ncbi:hypothetical protein M514_25046 [Trichuris suis]|uniref:Reverse transcriptase domain-containing protein n=1 Tax=Trichuris suis TaxID=68888 RepID=A0A085MZX0_9BILA|nr:hypothetical protein M514_25046 [Trichuris suis]
MLYADDVVLMAESRQELEEKVITWKNHLALYGLKLNLRKTEYMEFGSQTPGTISVHEPLTKALTFKYLGSYLSYEGGVTTDVSARIQTAWQKWKTLTAVLCDKKLPRKLKSKVYRTVIRPAVLYGSECRAITKKDEQRLSVMETTMLRRTIRISKLEHTPNETVRLSMGVAPIVDKVREKRLRWFGHVLRREDSHPLKRLLLHTEIEGKCPRGRPKLRWMDKVHIDLKELCLTPDQAHDRCTWKNITVRVTHMTSSISFSYFCCVRIPEYEGSAQMQRSAMLSARPGKL